MAINRALVPASRLIGLPLKPGPTASGARILPYQLPIAIPSPLRALSPLRGCRGQLIQAVENLRSEWRRGGDYSALRASPFGPPGRALSSLRRCRSYLNENVENYWPTGGEGGITRRCASRPSGAALAGVIPASSLPQ
jgi:hypothetical protein